MTVSELEHVSADEIRKVRDASIDLPLGDHTTTQGAETVSEPRTSPNNVSALILANLALIVTVIFGAGITYARVGSVEVRVSALEARENQLDALSAIQESLKTLKEEVSRARDRLDRAVDSTSDSIRRKP